MTTETRTAGSQTLERGLAVLVEISRHAGGRTTAELATDCGLHRSIIRRLLVSLELTGFARRDDAGRYHLGPALAGFPTPPPPILAQVAEPILVRLAAAIDATVTLVEIRGDSAVTTLVAEPPTDGPRVSYRVGSRDPVDRGAGGLAALASGPARAGRVRASGADPRRRLRHDLRRAQPRRARCGDATPGVGGAGRHQRRHQPPGRGRACRGSAPSRSGRDRIASAVRDEPGARGVHGAHHGGDLR